MKDVIQDFIKIIETEHVKAVQYSKEGNAVVERYSREILRHVRGLLHRIGNGNKWSSYSPLVQRILNSEVHDVA